MKIVINDLSFQTKFKSREDAIEAVRKWIAVCRNLQKKENTKSEGIFATIIDTGVEVAPAFKLIQLIQEFRTRDEQRYLMKLLVNSPRPEVLPDVPFRTGDKESFLCAWARDEILVSLESEEQYGKEKIDGKIGEEYVSISNISDERHRQVYAEELGIRIYKGNPKHSQKSYYLGGHPVSVMKMDDVQAQELLNRAVEIEGKLYAKKGEAYYSFQREQKNYYHAYENAQLPEHIKKKIDTYHCWE